MVVAKNFGAGCRAGALLPPFGDTRIVTCGEWQVAGHGARIVPKTVHFYFNLCRRRKDLKVMLRVFQWDKLSKCLHPDDVDPVFDELGIERDIGQRTLILYQYMGIGQAFTCVADGGSLTQEEEYIFAKHQLILMNERK